MEEGRQSVLRVAERMAACAAELTEVGRGQAR
jgi:hypothetical protein